MSNLNGDILYLIFKELQDNLYPCLSVNKTWCEVVIPILWKNPWKYYLNEGKEKLLLNVIISHLSENLRNNLDQDLVISYQRPIFSYISFCKHLNLNEIKKMISTHLAFELIRFPNINTDIYNLFINRNTKLTHLYIPRQFDYQIQLIPEAKHCFSELEFLSCDTSINN